MVAYTGIETISNLAEEAKDYEKTVPAAAKLVVAAVFAIYSSCRRSLSVRCLSTARA